MKKKTSQSMKLLMHWEEEVLVKSKNSKVGGEGLENFSSLRLIVPRQTQLRDICRQRKHLQVTEGVNPLKIFIFSLYSHVSLIVLSPQGC